jgi:hypothetical protein
MSYSEVRIPVDVPLDVLAIDIARSGASHEELLAFVIRLDEEIIDYQFTVALRDRLNSILALEGE